MNLLKSTTLNRSSIEMDPLQLKKCTISLIALAKLSNTYLTFFNKCKSVRLHLSIIK